VKRFFYILLTTVIVIGGVILLKKDNTSTAGNPTNHTQGKGTSGVTLVMYADFQCPGCGSFYPIMKQVTDHYKDEIKFQFVNFPLTNIHLNALAASRAAEAASKQNKFWEMHDTMFENQEHLTVDDLKKYAKDLGLDTEKFNQALDSGKFTNRVKEDITLGNKIGINATPTFYLNGKKLVVREGTDVEKAILKELGR
jgi:protein-disulfide isomerase